MNTDHSTTSASATQNMDDQLKELMDRVVETNRKITETNTESKENTDAIEVRIDESIRAVEKIYADLDQAEKEAGDELDTHLLQQAEDLASE